MSFKAPYGQHTDIGEHAGEAAALTWIQAQNWDTNKDGSGNPENGMFFYDTSANQKKVYVNGSWDDMGSAFHDHTHASSGAEGAQLDHGTAFSDYGTDDHTEYSLADGSRDFSGTVKGVTPTDDAHLTTKGYVDAMVDGLKWLDPVLNIQVDDTLDPGAAPTDGDRYILRDVGSLHANFGSITGVGDNDVVSYLTDEFVVVYDASVEGEGAAVYNEADNKRYTYNGTGWVLFSDLVNHNDLANIQGGGSSERQHLTTAQHTDLTDGNDCSIHKHDDIYYTETETDAMFNTSTGHDHDGSNSKKVDYPDLTNIPSTFTPSAHKTSHENGGGDEISLTGLSGKSAELDTHEDILAANATLGHVIVESGSDIDVDGSGKLTLGGHSSRHENGGNDEISVAGLSGELADNQPPKTHASAHQNGGGDEIDVGGLSGELADDQPPKAHVIDPGSGPHTGALLEANVTFDGAGHAHGEGADGAQVDHADLANKGTNTHSEIDTHIADVSIHNESYNGAGQPNGSQTAANIGDRYLDTTNMITYVKSTAGGNTGWVVS